MALVDTARADGLSAKVRDGTGQGWYGRQQYHMSYILLIINPIYVALCHHVSSRMQV